MIFSKDYLVNSMDVDTRFRLKPYRCLDLFQETAMLHADRMTDNTKTMDLKDLGWIITTWHLRINRLPLDTEVIKLETAAAPYKRIQASRRFSAKTENGELLFEADSLWLLMDKVKRRPARLPKSFLEAVSRFKSSEKAKKVCFDLPRAGFDELIDDVSFKCSRRDIDTNGHINNVSYFIWACDAVPDFIYNQGHLSEVYIKYLNEGLPNVPIKMMTFTSNLPDSRTVNSSSLSQGSENRMIELVSIFLPTDSDEKLSFLSEGTLSKKSEVYAEVISYWEIP